jgi:hypothetical protein
MLSNICVSAILEAPLVKITGVVVVVVLVVVIVYVNILLKWYKT